MRDEHCGARDASHWIRAVPLTGLLLLAPVVVACGPDAVGPDGSPRDASASDPPASHEGEIQPAALVVALEDARRRLLPGLGESAAERLDRPLAELIRHLPTRDRSAGRRAVTRAREALERLDRSGRLSAGTEPELDAIRLVLDRVAAAGSAGR
ncbi:MAG: hypothetical protein ACODAE_08770 [Gemmatimonadota bacterium]